MITKFTEAWRYWRGWITCALVIPYTRNWSWCEPLLQASLKTGKKHPKKTQRILGMADKVMGWQTLGAFNRQLAHPGLEGSFEAVPVETVAAEQAAYPEIAHAGSELLEGHCVGGDGFYAGTILKPPSN